MSVATRTGTSPVHEARTDKLRLVCLLGPNGAGKDSKVAKAMEVMGDAYLVLTMSTLLVEAQKKDPELKALAEKLMVEGRFVPDDVVIKVLFEALEKLEGTDKTIILNGFPRTEAQATYLVEGAEEGRYTIERVIVVSLDEQTVLERLTDRRVCPNRCPSSPYTVSDYHPPKVDGICDDCGAQLIQREDDKPEVIKRRYHEYQDNEPAIMDVMALRGNVSISSVNNKDGKKAQQRFNAILAEIAGF